MKILQLCKKFPFPLKDGEAIAVTHLSKALHQLGAELTLLAMNTKKHYFDVKQLPEDFDHYRQIHFVEVDNELKSKDAFLNLFSEESYHIARFISDDFARFLTRLLQKNTFDVIQLETLYLAPYIPIIRKYSKATIAMRAHNVEHEIWERVSENTPNFIKRWYLQHLTKKLRNFEIQQLTNYDLLVAISEKDLQTFQNFGYRGKSVVTPIGIDQRDYTPNPESYHRDISISFIGSLDWMPNKEGLQWFLDNVWGKLQQRFPKLTLHVAGRNTPDSIRHINKPNVTIHGEVPDAADFINEHSVMIVPLLSGSGMRAKILEGMALGKVVVTTSMGLEGVNAAHRKEVLVADTVEEFINCFQFCIESNGQLSKIGQSAQAFVVENYDNLSVARDLLKVYEAKRLEVV